MRHIVIDCAGILNMDRYFEYIESIRPLISNELYQFAIDVERYDLRSKKSLHDSWLEGIDLRLVTTDQKSYGDAVLTLTGPYHDRRHILEYRQVQKLTFCDNILIDYKQKDLLTHEITLTEAGLSHELVFDRDRTIQIVCAAIVHSEKFLLNP